MNLALIKSKGGTTMTQAACSGLSDPAKLLVMLRMAGSHGLRRYMIPRYILLTQKHGLTDFRYCFTRGRPDNEDLPDNIASFLAANFIDDDSILILTETGKNFLKELPGQFNFTKLEGRLKDFVACLMKVEAFWRANEKLTARGCLSLILFALSSLDLEIKDNKLHDLIAELQVRSVTPTSLYNFRCSPGFGSQYYSEDLAEYLEVGERTSQLRKLENNVIFMTDQGKKRVGELVIHTDGFIETINFLREAILDILAESSQKE